MAVSGLVNLSGLMDDAKRFAFVRQRRWPAAKARAVTLQDEVGTDEVYIMASHKGQPGEVAKGGGLGAAAGRQARRAAARWRRTSRPFLA